MKKLIILIVVFLPFLKGMAQQNIPMQKTTAVREKAKQIKILNKDKDGKEENDEYDNEADQRDSTNHSSYNDAGG